MLPIYHNAFQEMILIEPNDLVPIDFLLILRKF